jgi:VWFA-related protein
MKTALLSVLLTLGPAVAAQTPYIETFEVRLHNLDVVVTDAKGNPVRGLSKDDFVVVDEGATQNLTNFAVYDSGATGSQPVDGLTNNPSSDAEASAPPPRKFVFFIDELGVQRMARKRLYNSLKTFVDAMREGDIAAVVRPTTNEKIVQEFTGDRAAIERALKDAIDQSSTGFVGPKLEIQDLRRQLRNAGSPQLRREAKREYGDAAARRVEHRLGQVRALTSSLAGIEGKKIVVLVTMGLTAKPGSEAWDFSEMLGSVEPPFLGDDGVVSDDPSRTHHPIVHDFTKTITEIARGAAANGVTIYALEPDVPLDLLVTKDSAIPLRDGVSDRNVQLPAGFHSDILQNSEVTLASLTETTGGRWFRGLDRIDDTFRQVSNDISFYYSLAYRANGDADKARRVKVSVRNRPELRVRTRTEVLEKSTGREMSDLVVASLLYPRPVNELGITVTPGTPEQNRGLYTVPIDVLIPMKSLTFLRADDGNYVALFDLHFAASGERRDFGAGGKRQQKIEISPEQYAELGSVTYRYKTGVQVSPGRARIAIGVLDTATKLTGFRTVEVIAQ